MLIIIVNIECARRNKFMKPLELASFFLEQSYWFKELWLVKSQVPFKNGGVTYINNRNREEVIIKKQ